MRRYSATMPAMEPDTRVTRAALALSLALGASDAHAGGDGATEPIVLSYSAPAQCPAESAFFDGVRARTSRVRRTDDDASARRFSVTVEPRGAGYRASLQIETAAGRVNRRDVDGATCGEVVSAVALVAALAIDPEASLEPQPLAPVGPSPPVTDTPASSPPPLTVAEQPHPAPVLDTGPAMTSERVSRTTAYRWSVGGGPELLIAAVPSVAYGGGAHVDLAPRSNDPVAPSFRAALLGLTTHLVHGGAAAQLTWWLARAEVCPLRLGTANAAVEACARLSAGGLSIAGEGVDRPASSTRAWADAGLAAHLRWIAAPRLELSAVPALVLPLRRYQLGYAGSNGQTSGVADISVASMTLSAAAAYIFP